MTQYIPVKRLPRIIIQVQGGVVCLPVKSDTDDLEIYLIDYDNLQAARENPQEFEDAIKCALEPLRPEKTDDFQAALDAAINCVKEEPCRALPKRSFDSCTHG
jgi:hypothetical protein